MDREGEPLEETVDAPPNCGGQLTEPPLEISWTDIAASPEAVILPGADIQLSVQNVVAIDLEVEIWVDIHEYGTRRSELVATIPLAVNEKTLVSLGPTAPDTWWIAPASVRTAGHLSARAVVRANRADAEVLEIVYADPRWFHREPATLDAGPPRLVLYDESTRNNRYGKGAALAEVADEVLNDPLVLSVEFHDQASQDLLDAKE